MGYPRPSFSERDLDEILLTDSEIRERVEILAREISSDYGTKEVTVICVLRGALVFTADLMRCLNVPTRLDFLKAESYGSNAISRGDPEIACDLKRDICGEHVLVVDDILDTGRTLRAIARQLREMGPSSLKTCVLLDKPSRRIAEVAADYVGFSIPDEFVVGYGMDFAERYRNLPCIGKLNPAYQTTASA